MDGCTRSHAQLPCSSLSEAHRSLAGRSPLLCIPFPPNPRPPLSCLAPPQRYLLIPAVVPDGSRPDYLTTVDVDPDSETYSQARRGRGSLGGLEGGPTQFGARSSSLQLCTCPG